MEYIAATPESIDDWENELIVRDDGEDGFEKRSPDEVLGSVFVEGHDELYHPPERFRPSLFDIQIGSVALAANALWEELHTVTGAVLIRHIQLERIDVAKYSALDPSVIEEGTITFRCEVEATYPQYRRASITVPVRIVDGAASRGLFFLGAGERKRVLSKEGLEQYMTVKPWFTISRPPDVGLAEIDRVVHTDYPSYMRSRYTWDIGF
jgi:hypothetical protein